MSLPTDHYAIHDRDQELSPHMFEINSCLREFFGDNQLHRMSSTFASDPAMIKTEFHKRLKEHFSQCLVADLGSLNAEVVSYLSAYMLPLFGSIVPQERMKTPRDVLEVVRKNAPKLLELI